MSPTLQYFLYPLSPVLAMWLAACLLIVLEFFPTLPLSKIKAAVGVGAALLALYFTYSLIQTGTVAAATPPDLTGAKWLSEFMSSYFHDKMTLAFYAGISLFTLLGIVFMLKPFQDHSVQGEILVLVLFAASGMMLLVSSNSLLMAFLSLELLSLPTYVLVGIRRTDRESTEAALKYFLFGSFASVLMVFGIALLYGQFGTIKISELAPMVANLKGGAPQNSILLLAGMVLISVAAAFKVGIVPFHMWVPDVYQGAPSPITGFMGAAIKMAGFGLALRLFWNTFGSVSEQWMPIVHWLAILTMFIGNIAALAQDNLKRLFAYSSISHAGYLLVGFTAAAGGASPSVGPIFYYLVVYGLMFLGLLACIAVLERAANGSEIYNLSGLGFTHPLLAACIAIFALSGAGIPPTAGFFAKYFLFLEAVRAGNVMLVVLAVISSLIGAYYYLRVLVYLYMKDSKERLSLGLRPGLTYAGIVFCAISLFFFAVAPGALGLGSF